MIKSIEEIDQLKIFKPRVCEPQLPKVSDQFDCVWVRPRDANKDIWSKVKDVINYLGKFSC